MTTATTTAIWTGATQALRGLDLTPSLYAPTPRFTPGPGGVATIVLDGLLTAEHWQKLAAKIDRIAKNQHSNGIVLRLSSIAQEAQGAGAAFTAWQAAAESTSTTCVVGGPLGGCAYALAALSQTIVCDRPARCGWLKAATLDGESDPLVDAVEALVARVAQRPRRDWQDCASDLVSSGQVTTAAALSALELLNEPADCV